MTNKIEKQIQSVLKRVTRAAERANRQFDEIVVVGASKSQPIEAIVNACRSGLKHVGENFAQEARNKIPKVNEQLNKDGIPLPTWHFIGKLQRNKARTIVPLVNCVQSVDRIELALELNNRAARIEQMLEILIQVNLSNEIQKGGVRPDCAPRLLEACQSLSHLRVTGLMAIPVASSDLGQTRASFTLLRKLLIELQGLPGGETLQNLSMGMSADFEIAIEEGATQVRIGAELFGAREQVR